ncbi:hypothetical protein [Jeotgalibacillus campisalis]|uniref:DUF4083 domain-containing protein n=1 Tax=Jeotgalibacillus campisalis TaxID=220754 RepID=A0A0C2VIF1_9BACL|nr:hypothetical protein [Jeotgalibacillus campisalis]KIL48647.1 hypothetical protein KR50_12320 [Jeotgalibacillus campisalis]
MGINAGDVIFQFLMLIFFAGIMFFFVSFLREKRRNRSQNDQLDRIEKMLMDERKNKK